MAFKIAVIGCGWVSKACHGPAYQKYAASHADTELTACCDVDAQRALEFQQTFGFQRVYTDYAQMLAVEQPSAVCLNVPVRSIAPMGVEIMRRGYPLLSEKPPGTNTAEISALIGAAEEVKVANMVAFNRRHIPLFRELKRWSGSLPIHHIHYHFCRVGRSDEDFTTTAIHAVDAARFLAGSDYRSIRFHYQDFPYGDKILTNFTLECVFASGASANLTILPATGISFERAAVHCPGHSFFVHCSHGADAPGKLGHYQEGKLVGEISGAGLSLTQEDYILNGFYAEDAAFFDAVREGRKLADDFQSCRQSVEVMEAMRLRQREVYIQGF